MLSWDTKRPAMENCVAELTLHYLHVQQQILFVWETKQLSNIRILVTVTDSNVFYLMLGLGEGGR